MKYQLLFFLFFISINICAFGQGSKFAVGFNVQPGYSAVDRPIVSNQNLEGDFSLSIGLVFNYNLHKKWYLQAGISYQNLSQIFYEDNLRWGTEFDGNGGHQPDPNLPQEVFFVDNLYFVDILLGTRYYFNESRIRFFVFPHLEGNIYLSNRNEMIVTYDNGDQEEEILLEDNFSAIRKLNISAGMGIGAEWIISPQIRAIVMPSFGYMLMPLSKNPAFSDAPRFYNLGVQLGFEYQF